MKPRDMTATAAAAAIREGSLSSEALVQSCLERIHERDPEVHAFAHVDAEHALRQARERDGEPPRGPLHGIPVAVKDMIDTVDLPTQHNSPIFAGHRPGKDAACVRILRSLGAVILGKTDTVEFAAAGNMPATRNPHDLHCTPGGSSSGSAAAVADFMAPLALGTQTGGSTIRPASYCGIFGMKPTYNEVSFEGAKPFSVSLDTIGWMARSVADLALLAGAFGVGRGRWQPRESAAGLRIGLCRTPMWEQAEADSRDAVERAAAMLEAAGATVVELELPPPFAEMNALHDVVMQGEGRTAFRDLYLAYPALLHDDFKAKVEDRLGISPQRLVEARDAIAASRPVFDRLAAAFDAVLTPAVPGEAPQGLETTGLATFNRTWSAMHVPCITVPFARGRRGLPVGVQLVGPRYGDLGLLGVAQAVAGCLSPQRVPAPP
jgi:Asp-tRNA(Asn)/Glu-tRNA(Gln) amidotransferase A subunit family amidase